MFHRIILLFLTMVAQFHVLQELFITTQMFFANTLPWCVGLFIFFLLKTIVLELLVLYKKWSCEFPCRLYGPFNEQQFLVSRSPKTSLVFASSFPWKISGGGCILLRKVLLSIYSSCIHKMNPLLAKFPVLSFFVLLPLWWDWQEWGV